MKAPLHHSTKNTSLQHSTTLFFPFALRKPKLRASSKLLMALLFALSFSINSYAKHGVATDGSNHTASSVPLVRVNNSPIITCPPSVTVNNDPGQCGAVIHYDLPHITDNSICNVPTTLP